jgi:molybdenum cofactor synthesis domain-containing protein
MTFTPPQSPPRKRKTAAALVIGNEILNGKTLDTNTQVLAQFLFKRGVVLKCAETIQDDPRSITRSVARLASTHDFVFSSGGIGPTLDDVTYQSIADAFGTDLVVSEETILRMKEISPQMDINDAQRRMATLPVSGETLWTDGLWVCCCDHTDSGLRIQWVARFSGKLSSNSNNLLC